MKKAQNSSRKLGRNAQTEAGRDSVTGVTCDIGLHEARKA